MPVKLLMGNEALGLGAMHAGVNFVSGYPGTPSTEVLETIAKHNDGSIHVEWSTNEKAALEAAAGAAYAGARALVTMKQVGLNVASDPLMTLSYIGVEAASSSSWPMIPAPSRVRPSRTRVTSRNSPRCRSSTRRAPARHTA